MRTISCTKLADRTYHHFVIHDLMSAGAFGRHFADHTPIFFGLVSPLDDILLDWRAT